MLIPTILRIGKGGGLAQLLQCLPDLYSALGSVASTLPHNTVWCLQTYVSVIPAFREGGKRVRHLKVNFRAT